MLGDRRSPRIGSGILFAAALLAALSIAMCQTGCDSQNRPDNSGLAPQRQTDTPPAGQSVTHTQGPPLSGSQAPIKSADDLQFAWESPTAGGPLDVPGGLSGAQLILQLRLAELWQSPEFQRACRLLDTPTLAKVRQVEQVWCVPARDIEQLTWMAAPRGEQRVDWMARVTLRPGAICPAAWIPIKDTTPTTSIRDTAGMESGNTEYQLPDSCQQGFGQLAARVVSGNRARQLDLIIAPAKWLRWESEEAPPPVLLRRDLGRLVALSDRDRHVSVLATTSLLLSHPEWLEALFGRAPPTRPILKQATAVMLSCHWNQHEFYLEFIGTAPLEQQLQMTERYRRLASDWCAAQQSIANGWPPQVTAGPFGRRWPAMAEFFTRHLRFESTPDATLVNASLPNAASHNLLCGMLLATRFPVSAGAERRPSHITWASLLDAPITYQFKQRPLDQVVAGLETLIRETVAGAESIRLMIDGSALESAGVTRNQQLRNFQANEMPLADVLQQLARVAQPGTPGPFGRLVWCCSAENQQITRVLALTAAEKEGRAAEFRRFEPMR